MDIKSLQRRWSQVRCLKRVQKFLTLYLFADFYRNYILINDIILIYELVGVELLMKFFLCKQICKSRTWLFSCRNSIWVHKYFLQSFSFPIFHATENKIATRGGVRQDITRLTGGNKISLFALFSSESTLMNTQIAEEKMRENPNVIRIIGAKMMIHSEIKGAKFLKYSPAKKETKYT